MEGVWWIVEPLPSEVANRREAERRVAYGLLCRLMGGTPRVEYDLRGRPFLPEFAGWSVSISHCRVAVAVAVGKVRGVGIDVESRRKVSAGLMERACTEGELALVKDAADPTMAFLRLWTRKEAVLKCKGTGIQGFASLREALVEGGMNVETVGCDIPDVVISIASW